MMNRNLRKIIILLIIMMVLIFSCITVYSEKESKSVDILFTHDLHDHFFPFSVEDSGAIKTLGGYARLYSIIKMERAKNPDLLLLDGGDFSMGTLFQTIFDSDSPQLRMLGHMGYDITTFGNHDFDFRAEGLAKCLKIAKDSGDKLPQIVASNISFPIEDGEKLSSSLRELQQSFEYYGVRDYAIIERNGIKIGIFGLMGKEAASNAPMAGVKFEDPINSAKQIVKILKDEEKAELIVCLSHSGTWEDKSKSEDEILAKEVPDIDIIISGHTHTAHHDPIIVGDTIIGSSGRYGENLGVISITLDSSGKWGLDEYRLEAVTDSIPMDGSISTIAESYKSIIQEKYLNKFNMLYDDILAFTPFNFTSYGLLGNVHEEDILGNLISDSYIYAVRQAEGDDYKPIAAAIVPYGTIRGSFVQGNITVSDVFAVSSLGIGADGAAGYPLISVYLTGKELKIVAEVDASIAPIKKVAQLYISGLNFTFNPKRLIFNKVTDVYLKKEDGSREEINDSKLYRVVAGLYSAQMLSIVGDESHGLLSIVPKTEDGTPIIDFEKQIICDGDYEIKEWLAIAQYLKSFDKEKGIPKVPLYYSEKQGRKVIDNDSNILARLKNPNRIALGLYGIVLVILTLIGLLTRFIIKRKKALAR